MNNFSAAVGFNYWDSITQQNYSLSSEFNFFQIVFYKIKDILSYFQIFKVISDRPINKNKTTFYGWTIKINKLNLFIYMGEL